AVRPDEHEVLELLVRKLDVAADGVVPRRDALVRHAEADRTLVLVRLSLLDQPARELRAVLQAVELQRDVAVPVEPEPAQRILDLLRRLRHLAARGRVLDPQLELPALLAREPAI